jgi:hypothetical protein
MRRSFLLAVCAVTLTASVASAAVRMPLMEEFTNVQCAPCAGADPMIRAFIANHYPDELAVVYWHMNWPGFDPFWTDNPADNNARRFRYGVNAIPDCVMNGTDQADPRQSPGLEARYDAAHAVPSSMNLVMSGTRVMGGGVGSVTVDMTAETDFTSTNLFLYVVMAEQDVNWNGIGSYDVHHFLARKTLSGSNGENLTPFAATEARSRTYNWALDPAWTVDGVENNLIFTAFIQDHGTHEILNAATIEIADFAGTVSVGPVGEFVLGGVGANYPNPFNPLTHIPIYLANAGRAVVAIHAADGSLVRTLSQGAFPSGQSTLQWDGTDNAGAPIGSGVYFVRLTGDGIESSRAITLLK